MTRLIYLKVYITACWRMLKCIWRIMWQKRTDLESVKQLLAKKMNLAAAERVIAPVWKRTTLGGANRVIDHSFPSEAPYAMIPGKTQVHLMESCELFSTLLNDKCDLIEIKTFFFFVQSSIKHSSILAGICCPSSYIDTFVQSWQNNLTVFLWQTNGEHKCKIHYSFYTKCLFMNKQLFTYKNLYA